MIDGWTQRLQYRARGGALQCQQGTPLLPGHLGLGATRPNQYFIVIFTGAINNQKKTISCQTGDNQVVVDTALCIGQQGVTRLTVGQGLQVNGHQGFEFSDCVRARDQYLAHMRDIEQSGGSACLQMLLDDARWVLDGHIISGKRNHFGASVKMHSM